MKELFEFEEEDQSIIGDLLKTYTFDNLWTLNETTKIRGKIKSFYISKQNNICCYCNQKILTKNHRNWDLDHIIPRDTHPSFVFEPRNLSASCVDCNIAKSNTQTLKNKNRKRYPEKSSDYIIVHPIFDEYDDHIFRLNMVYIPKTNKGKKTIEMCNLLRHAVEFMDWSDKPNDERFEGEVEIIFKGSDSEALDSLRKITALLK